VKASLSADRAPDDVLVIGSGFAGIGMAIALLRRNITRFTVLEQKGEVGGTWRDNRYPGAACDVESHLYSFSFEPNPNWTRTFAGQEEILEYLKYCARKYAVYPHVRFHSSAVAAEWDHEKGLWYVTLRGGEVLSARVVVSACGGLSRPLRPEIRGLSSFRGKMFHSAEWDDTVGLAGKRVAVIGTGASAIQIVPAIAAEVQSLSVFQRTPPWILPKIDPSIGVLRRALFRRVPALLKLRRQRLYWLREAMALGFVVEPRLLKAAEILSRRFLRRSVKSPDLRSKLLPSYRMGCKRILPTNAYYPALQRPNVELVTEGIEEILESGIRTKDGRERAFDAIVLAVGFRVAEEIAPFPIIGRDGRRLDETWHDGAQAYLGATVSGFPNLFFMVGPNTGLGHNSMILMIESQIAYALDAIQTIRTQGLKSVDVLVDVQARYNEGIQARMGRTVWASGCRSWYLSRSGRNTTLWPGFTFEFRRKTARFDACHYALVPLNSGQANL
jgi:cation diffusion facilitator CzcD-associated flavoprotein CzcO